MCGPSNPLQQFKQQTQLDRTLQQDRLAQRGSPIQGFRSHNPNAGLLDPEFEAFQAGLPPSELGVPQFQLHYPAIHGPSQAGPDWASDFQRMNISSPPHQHHAVQQAGPSTANWAHGFRAQIANQAPRAQQTASPSPWAFQQQARYGGGGFQSQIAQPSFQQPMMQSKGKEAVQEQFDDAAFEAAFDQAREEMQLDAQPKSELGPITQQDYSMQLLLLEQQNKHRRMEAERREESRAQAGRDQAREKMQVDAEYQPALEDYGMQRRSIEQPNKGRLVMARQEQVGTNAESRTALEAYQEQLMSREQTNKERLLAARQEQDAGAFEEPHGVSEAQVRRMQEAMNDTARISESTDIRTENQSRLEQLMKDELQLAQEQEQASDQKQREEDDALAATAQELLEKVENNTTDKFRNSQFLGLMRKLRDREMKVEGDRMVETVSATQHLTHTSNLVEVDSGYTSGTATPDIAERVRRSLATPPPGHRTPPPEFDTHMTFFEENHEYDHWESPMGYGV